jgi:Flp pilus assembly pilin Flp
MSGQTMTEYGLIISSVIVGLILLYQQAGNISSFLVNQVVPLF